MKNTRNKEFIQSKVSPDFGEILTLNTSNRKESSLVTRVLESENEIKAFESKYIHIKLDDDLVIKKTVINLEEVTVMINQLLREKYLI